MSTPIVVTYLDNPGLTLFAFPVGSSLASWSSRVEFNQADSPNTGRYTATLDADVSEDWAIFVGATQPASFGEAIAMIEEVGVIPIQVGTEYRWRNQAGETLDVTIDEVP